MRPFPIVELPPPLDDHLSLLQRDKAVVEDPDEYRSAGAFIVPEDARWDNIRKQAQADDIKIRLDNILELMEDAYPERLRGLLPRIYAGSNLARENVTGLINLFSRDVFKEDHGGEDLVGRVYEYFIGEFASSEGKRGGEYFTPLSIVGLLVSMLEPEHGIVIDPCCGSGGMFVQSDLFTKHNRRLSFYGQESKDFTYRLCRMNMFIHGIDGNIELGNSYFNDKHPRLQADYILANPPFNDGSKSREGWGADRVPDKDPRLALGTERMPLAPRNGNTMWMLHFLYHLKATGTAGFVMAAGELSAHEKARLEVRRKLVDEGYLDCVVQLTGQLFANTQIPCDHHERDQARQGEVSDQVEIRGLGDGALGPGFLGNALRVRHGSSIPPQGNLCRLPHSSCQSPRVASREPGPGGRRMFRTQTTEEHTALIEREKSRPS